MDYRRVCWCRRRGRLKSGGLVILYDSFGLDSSYRRRETVSRFSRSRPTEGENSARGQNSHSFAARTLQWYVSSDRQLLDLIPSHPPIFHAIGHLLDRLDSTSPSSRVVAWCQSLQSSRGGGQPARCGDAGRLPRRERNGTLQFGVRTREPSTAQHVLMFPVSCHASAHIPLCWVSGRLFFATGNVVAGGLKR